MASLALNLDTWQVFIYCLITVVPIITSQPCPESLLRNCTCFATANAQLNITCEGNDIVNITNQLPPNTVFYQYKAMELFVNLEMTDFSHVPQLETLSIQDIGDYNILWRKISPIAGDAIMFSNLAKLKVLVININWEMETQLPDIFKGLVSLETLDLSNTRLMNINNLILSLQGLQNSSNLKELNLWNIKTMEHSAPGLEFDLDKVLEPLSNITLETLNIGYNAFRYIKPGLLQYAPHLKRIIARNNVLLPISTSSILTEVYLHKTLEVADFSEQGFRPLNYHPHVLETSTHSGLSSSKIMHEYTGLQESLSTNELLALVDNHQSSIILTKNNFTDKLVQPALTKIPDLIKQYIECFILLYDDTCNILSETCTQVKHILIQEHELFCDLLMFFFKWHFYHVPCEYIPSFDELISPDCGACLVVPTLGNVRELYVSHLNIYDYVLLYRGYRGRPLCFYPNSSLEVLDFSGNYPYGYPEMYKIFHADIRGVENLREFNCSQNALDTLYSNISTNFPKLQTLDASHNRISLALSDQDSFISTVRSVEYIDLSYNEIEHVGQDKLTTLENLQYLDLSHNSINEFMVNVSNLKRLEFLDLSSNDLTSIPEFTFSQLNQVAMSNSSRNLSINFGSNNLICTCATKDFVNWVLHSHPSNLILVDMHQYNCTNRYSNQVPLHSVTMQMLYLECYESIIYGCIGTLSGIILVLMLLAYKRRFYLRHKLYKWNKKLKKRSYNQRHHEYDAFICYDRADSDWVDYEAKRYLKQFKIVYGEEDIEFGQNIPQAVCDHIEKSQRSILVLSPNSVNSPNTLYNMHIVEEKLKFTGNDILIIVKLKPLNRVGLDKTLSELMEHRLCLEWKENNQDAQEFFWERLSDAIEAPCEEFYDAPANERAALIQ